MYYIVDFREGTPQKILVSELDWSELIVLSTTSMSETTIFGDLQPSTSWGSGWYFLLKQGCLFLCVFSVWRRVPAFIKQQPCIEIPVPSDSGIPSSLSQNDFLWILADFATGTHNHVSVTDLEKCVI